MSKRILILSPETFSAPGGIQSLGRSQAYVLHQLSRKNSWQIRLHALNDPANTTSSPYLPTACFKGFNRNKFLFTIQSIWKGMHSDLIILNHVNLSFPALVIRFIRPGCKIWLVAHGTEAWRPFSGWRKSIWRTADRILCASSFTRDQITNIQQANAEKCTILNPIADPFIQAPQSYIKPEYLLKRYGLKPTDKVVLTLTRISDEERDKGYDQVIRVLSKIRRCLPNIHYLLAGPCNHAEETRIKGLVADNGLARNFTLTGYIKKEELADHYLLADLFVLPSKKEGFGIVLLEAMVFGLPVICGNQDGSTDAVRHEGMGIVINPDDPQGLELAIRKKLHQVLAREFRMSIQQEALKHFNEQQYSHRLEQLINHEP